MAKKNQFDITKYALLHDNVLIEALEVEESVSGIISPSQYEDKPEFGRVISVGVGIIMEEAVEKDDIVVFNKYSTTKFRVEGKDYYVVRLEDIVGYLC